MNIEIYIKKSIERNQLKVESGQKHWRKYFLSITELVWGRNLQDGYKIDIYDEQYGNHLGSVVV